MDDEVSAEGGASPPGADPASGEAQAQAQAQADRADAAEGGTREEGR
jgi:hypothetical protein